MIRVYVAGPLGKKDRWPACVKAAIKVAAQLLKLGFAPFVPHLWAAAPDADSDTLLDYEGWMAYDFSWVERSDALLRFAPSPGADREMAHALLKGIPVFQSVEALVNWRAQRERYSIQHIAADAEPSETDELFTLCGAKVYDGLPRVVTRGIFADSKDACPTCRELLAHPETP